MHPKIESGGDQDLGHGFQDLSSSAVIQSDTSCTSPYTETKIRSLIYCTDCPLSFFLISSYLEKQLALERESSSLWVQHKKVQDRVELMSCATMPSASYRTQQLLRVSLNKAVTMKPLARLARGDRRAELEKPATLLECQDLSGVSPLTCRQAEDTTA